MIVQRMLSDVAGLSRFVSRNQGEKHNVITFAKGRSPIVLSESSSSEKSKRVTRLPKGTVVLAETPDTGAM